MQNCTVWGVHLGGVYFRGIVWGLTYMRRRLKKSKINKIVGGRFRGIVSSRQKKLQTSD